jgi:hypothetical protein
VSVFEFEEIQGEGGEVGGYFAEGATCCVSW